jgi:hypothetical protein
MQAGRYKARATAVALGMTSTGKEQVIVSFQALDTGEMISWYGYFSERTWERTVEALRICGWTGDDLTDFEGGNLAGIDTHEVEIVVEDEPDMDGVPRSRVRWVNMLRGSGIAVKQPLEGPQLKTFAQQMRGKILSLDKAKPAQKPTRPAPAARQKPRQADPIDAEMDDAPPF